MLSICERRKNRHKFGGTKVCKAEEVRKYLVYPKTENRSFKLVCKLHYIQFGFQKYLMNFLFIAYENDESCHFVVHIGSPALISYYCVYFVSFYFFLFFLVFLWLLLLAGVLRYVWQYLKQSSGVVPSFLNGVSRGELLLPYLVINVTRIKKEWVEVLQHARYRRQRSRCWNSWVSPCVFLTRIALFLISSSVTTGCFQKVNFQVFNLVILNFELPLVFLYVSFELFEK